MYGYIIEPEDLDISTTRGTSSSPLSFAATAFNGQGMPLGLVAVKGEVYKAYPDDLPALIMYEDNVAEIRSNYDVELVITAKYIISGSCLLVEDNASVTLHEPGLNLTPTKSTYRTGIGVTSKGKVLTVTQECTLEELQKFFLMMGCRDAMQLSWGDVYLKDTRGGIKLMGTTMPITTLEASDFKALKRPIVVIDAGHGGSDPGAVGHGLREKDINLSIANAIYLHLSGRYQGTFLMTRIDDSYLSLKERSSMINGIGADFVISVHSNGHNDASAMGYETFTYTSSSKVSDDMQRSIHSTVMEGLGTVGIRDRGQKKQNFHMLRETKCPAVLVENLFVTNEAEARLLRDKDFLISLGNKTAEGIATGLGLSYHVYKDTIKQEEEQPLLFKVQVGAYAVRKNAEAMEERLRDAGFPAFITKA